jgi:hypothetical protein
MRLFTQTNTFSLGEKVLLKSRLLAYPGVVVGVDYETVTVAIAPEGNKSDFNGNLDLWVREVVDFRKLKRYEW